MPKWNVLQFAGKVYAKSSLLLPWIKQKFGTAFLQIPVDGAFLNGCEHFIENISRGYQLIVVYDLGQT
jgi:hypothetical protein